MALRVSFVVALVTALIGFASSPAAAQSARTFYIDYAGGSNTNNGTSKSTPWKTHPYMQASSACTGTGSVPAYSHVAGDQFIFKGGVSWPGACFTMTIQDGGTSILTDYYGVDLTWFNGGSFTRPKFDLNFTVPTLNMVIQGTANSNNIGFDNLEIVHQGINATGAFATEAAFEFVNGGANVTIKNSLIHDWVATNNITFNTLNYSAGSVYGSIILDHTEMHDINGYFGAGHTAVRFGGACEGCNEVKNSKIHDAMAACFSVSLCHDNEFYNITADIQAYDSNIHTQVIEDDGNGVDIVYNNVIHDNNPVGVTIYECDASQIYNNVLWNNGNKEILISACSGQGSSAVASIYNNTVDCSTSAACFGTDSKGTLPGTVNLKNNHWITNGSPISNASAVATFNQSNNVTMSTATATSQGYTSANKYAPTASTDGTVNTAVNLSGLCSGVLSSLCTDVLHNPRLTSWDAGAYEFGSTSTKPAAPSNLSATVQ